MQAAIADFFYLSEKLFESALSWGSVSDQEKQTFVAVLLLFVMIKPRGSRTTRRRPGHRWTMHSHKVSYCQRYERSLVFVKPFPHARC
jgi:hypothetical protein